MGKPRMQDIEPMGGTAVPAEFAFYANRNRGVPPYLGLPLRPFQFPSPSHFHDRALRAIVQAGEEDGLKPSTLLWARRAVGSFSRYLEDTQLADNFLRGDLEEQLRVLAGWNGWQRRRQISRTTINTTWRGLSSVCRWIARRDGTVNPFHFAKAPRPQNRIPRYLTREDASRLLTFVRNYPWGSPLTRARNLAIIGVMLLCGLRRGELPRLEVADVDLAGGTMHIRAAKGRDGGKDRIAYMPPQLREIMAMYITERRNARRTNPELFSDVRRNRGMGVCAIRRVCEIASRGMGVPFSPHALRHTYATLLRASHVEDRVAMELLGHSSVTMLYRYSHLYDGERERAAAKLHLDFAL